VYKVTVMEEDMGSDTRRTVPDELDPLPPTEGSVPEKIMVIPTT
jgi:hypothetical protein